MGDGAIRRQATLADVARDADVSLKTVSRVINGVDSVNPEMAERVRESVERLGYRHNRLAAMLRTGRSGMIGMVARDLTNPFYSTLAAGVSDVACEQDALVAITQSDGDVQRQSRMVSGLLDRRVDGLILTPAEGHDPSLEGAWRSGLPVVALDVAPEGLDTDAVVLDNFQGAHDGILTAALSGYRRFAMVLHSYERRTMEVRAAGARAALEELGLPCETELIQVGSHSSAEAGAWTAALLDREDPPDAIFCANNIVSIGVASVLRQRRANVALVSFDDFALSDTLPIPVWVVAHDPRQMGATAARLLFERLATPGGAPRVVTVQTEIRARGDMHAIRTGRP